MSCVVKQTAKSTERAYRKMPLKMMLACQPITGAKIKACAEKTSKGMQDRGTEA